jgi:hypothetical protein
MNEDTIWKPHLRPGERVLWSADASGKLRRAEISRRRTAALVIGLATGTLAVAFGWKLYESFLPGPHQPDLGAAIAAPLYGALALTFAAVFAAQLGRLNPQLSRAVRYAATDARLIAADETGGVIDQLHAEEIAGLILGGRRAAPDLFILRKNDPAERRAFAIEHIERPFEAKAILEDQFLEPSTEEST